MLCQAPIEVNKYYPEYTLGQQTFQQRREQTQAQLVQSQSAKVRELQLENEQLIRDNTDLKLRNQELEIRLQNWKDALLVDTDGTKQIEINKETCELKVRGAKSPSFLPNYQGLTEAEKQVKILKKELFEERQRSKQLQQNLKNYEKELARQSATLNIYQNQPNQHYDKQPIIPQPLYHSKIQDDQKWYLKDAYDREQQYQLDRRNQERELQDFQNMDKQIKNSQKLYDQKYKVQEQQVKAKMQQYYFVNDPEVDVSQQCKNYEQFYNKLVNNQKFQQIQPDYLELQRQQQYLNTNQKKYYDPIYMQDLMPVPQIISHQQPYNPNPISIQGNGVVYRPVQEIQKPQIIQQQQQNFIMPQQYLQNETPEQQGVKEYKMSDIQKSLENNDYMNKTALKNSWRIVNDVPDIQETQKKTFY